MKKFARDRKALKAAATSKQKNKRENQFRKALRQYTVDDDRAVLNNRTHGRFGPYNPHDVIELKMLFDEFDTSGTGRITKKMVQDADIFSQAEVTSEEGLKGSSKVLVKLLNSCFEKTKSPSISLEDFIKTVFPYAKHEERHRMLAMLEIHQVLAKLARQVQQDLIKLDRWMEKVQASEAYNLHNSAKTGVKRHHRPPTRLLKTEVPSEVQDELDTCFFRCKSDHFGTVGLPEYLEVLHSHHLVTSIEELKKAVLSKEELRKTGSGKELDASEACLILSDSLSMMARSAGNVSHMNG